MSATGEKELNQNHTQQYVMPVLVTAVLVVKIVI
jgi:hypothetical protein